MYLGQVIVAVSCVLASVVHTSSGRKCCSSGPNILNQYNQSRCLDNSTLWVYTRCDSLYMIDPKSPPAYETFHEDKDTDELTLHSDQWTTKTKE